MGRFLDLFTSENSNATGSIGVTLSTDPTNPQLFGGIGLQTGNVFRPVVDLSGTVGVSGPVGATFQIRIVRNSPTIAGSVIYSAIGNIPVVTPAGAAHVVSFSAQDLDAPTGLLTTYAAFINTVTAFTIIRVGPEVFYGIAAERQLS